jgi:hypothetical protein
MLMWTDLAAKDPEQLYHIQVPGSVKNIKEKLRYEVRKEPHVDLGATKLHGTQFLEMGRSARIILEGGRLWRSTVVTMGQQQAEKIEVLPDMRGIIAEFKCVKPPPGLSGHEEPPKDFKHPRITVWTSEGRAALPPIFVLKQFTRRQNPAEDQKTNDFPCCPDAKEKTSV